MSSFQFERVKRSEEFEEYYPISGGLLSMKEDGPDDIEVSWSYLYNNSEESAVVWSFRNRSQYSTQRFILFRNDHYFGSSYWPVYVNDPGFRISFTTSLDPLPEVSTYDVMSSTAPLAVVRHPNGNLIVCFVFTLSPLDLFQIAEGGYKGNARPENALAVRVNPIGCRDFRIRYDEKHEEIWNKTVTRKPRLHEAYKPNPSTFRGVLLEPQDEMQDQENFPFNDEIEVKDVDI